MNENRITQIGYYRNVVNQLIQIQLYKEHNHDYEHKIFELKESFLNLSRSFNLIESSEDSNENKFEIIDKDDDMIFYIIHLLSEIMFDDNLINAYVEQIFYQIQEFIEDL